MVEQHEVDFSGLSEQQRIQLALDLWESIDHERKRVDIAPEVIEELLTRSANIRSGKEKLVDWPDLKRALLSS